MANYAKSNEGITHLINEVGGEHTLCGDAWDGQACVTEVQTYRKRPVDPTAWVAVSSGPVNCSKCAAIILSCRGVKIAKTLMTSD